MDYVRQDSFDGRKYIEDLLRFWSERLQDYMLGRILPKEKKKEIEIIEGLLHSDAPFRLWEECQSGFFHKSTIQDVQKVDKALFKLRYLIMPIPEEQKDTRTILAESCESLLVFCICNGLRKEGRLIE